MATFHKGNSGAVWFGNTELYVSEWTLVKNPRLDEITHSGSAGAAQWKKTVVEGSGRIAGPWDSTVIPDTDISADAGDEVTLKLYVGDSGKFYSFAAVIDNLEITNPQTQGVSRFSLNYKSNGAITDPVT